MLLIQLIKDGNSEHVRNRWPIINLKQSMVAISGHCAIRPIITTNNICKMCWDRSEEASVKHIICVCFKLCEIRMVTLRSIYFKKLAGLADIIIGQLTAFIWHWHWFNDRDWTHILLVSPSGITTTDLLKWVSIQNIKSNQNFLGGVGNCTADSEWL